MDGFAAPWRAACARPDRVAAAVDAVVVRDLLAGSDVTQRDDDEPAIDSFDVHVRIAGMIDVPFGILHQYDEARGQVVAVAGIVTGSKRTIGVDHTAVIDP